MTPHPASILDEMRKITKNKVTAPEDLFIYRRGEGGGEARKGMRGPSANNVVH